MPSPPTSPLSLHDALPISSSLPCSIPSRTWWHHRSRCCSWCRPRRSICWCSASAPAGTGASPCWPASRSWACSSSPSGSSPSSDRKSTRLNSSHGYISYAVPPHVPSFPTRRSSDLKLAPVFNPVTHMVAPPFPLLLVVPAAALDLLVQRFGPGRDWRLAVLAGVTFLGVFFVTQWFFTEFRSEERRVGEECGARSGGC